MTDQELNQEIERSELMAILGMSKEQANRVVNGEMTYSDRAYARHCLKIAKRRALKLQQQSEKQPGRKIGITLKLTVG